MYDALDGPRDDLDAYVAIARELGARTVLDVGCGTGSLAILLAREGIGVVALDPAGASLDVARLKPGAENIRWIEGDASGLPALGVDLATMTGNVAQAIHEPALWDATLTAVHRALRPGGALVFETRDPDFRGWKEWTRAASHRVVETPAGAVETWVELTDVALPLVSFRWTFAFRESGDVLTSDSTLRFRERDEVETQLAAHGFVLADVRDAPDRPGRELVFVALRPAA